MTSRPFATGLPASGAPMIGSGRITMNAGNASPLQDRLIERIAPDVQPVVADALVAGTEAAPSRSFEILG